MQAMRPEALVSIRENFAFLENTLLADGRDWILKTDAPSLADIHCIWPFHWLTGMKGALPPTLVSDKQFPRMFAWIKRFEEVVKQAKGQAPKPATVKGPEAVEKILGAEFGDEASQSVLEGDPTGLKKGDEVQVWPTDSGQRHRERGILVGLTEKEIVIEVQRKPEQKSVRVHAPRHGFRIRKMGGGGSSNL